MELLVQFTSKKILITDYGGTEIDAGRTYSQGRSISSVSIELHSELGPVDHTSSDQLRKGGGLERTIIIPQGTNSNQIYTNSEKAEKVQPR